MIVHNGQLKEQNTSGRERTKSLQDSVLILLLASKEIPQEAHVALLRKERAAQHGSYYKISKF